MRPLARQIVTLLGTWACITASTEAQAGKPKAIDPEGMSLKGDQEGTAFRTLTVEGEDRVHFEIERPSLDLQVDPTQAPGLDWGSAHDVLDRTVPDGMAPLLAASTGSLTPYLARPWLRTYAVGDVARFRPQVDQVDRWRLVVADSRGETVRSFEGRGEPKQDIAWDGRNTDGKPASPGLTYSYVFEARDRAGNKRNFVGQGFELPAYRLATPKGPVLAFAAEPVAASAGASREDRTPSPYVLEAASWLNQIPATQPVRVTATARSFQQAKSLADGVAASLASLLVGSPQRVQVQTQVEPDAHPAGTVAIAPAP
jgi:FlgD Ig-like domain